MEIAADFARMPESQHNQFIEKMGQATNSMLNLTKDGVLGKIVSKG